MIPATESNISLSKLICFSLFLFFLIKLCVTLDFFKSRLSDKSSFFSLPPSQLFSREE